MNNIINSKINSNNNTQQDTYETKQSELFETMRKQQEINNNMNQKNNSPDNNNMLDILQNIKNNTSFNKDEDSSISISSTMTQGSKKSILKIDTT